jgi:hypothetical protein
MTFDLDRLDGELGIGELIGEEYPRRYVRLTVGWNKGWCFCQKKLYKEKVGGSMID